MNEKPRYAHPTVPLTICHALLTLQAVSGALPLPDGLGSAHPPGNPFPPFGPPAPEDAPHVKAARSLWDAIGALQSLLPQLEKALEPWPELRTLINDSLLVPGEDGVLPS